MYAKRLAIGSTPSPVLVNGAVLPRNEIIDERLGDETWLPSQFLAKAVHKRNTLVIPEDEDLTEFFDLSKLSAKQLEIYHDLPRWKGDNSVTKDMWAQLIIIGDMSFLEIQIILKEALHVRQDDPGLEIVVLHNPAKDSKPTRVFQILQDQMSKLGAPSTQPEGDATKLNSPDFWEATAGLLEILKISQGQTTLLLNGRVVGPVPAASGLDRNDIAQLLGFERTERARPINAALEKLGLADRVSDHYAWAQLISLVASSSKSSASPGALEAASRERVDFSEHWNTTHSALRVGNADNIVIYLVAVLDPASEIAQRWLPILNAVCKLQGVYLKLILNPRDNLQELPIKRFYRYVLQSEPLFNADGSVKGLSAQFEDLPRDALLTVGLDVPSSWLVAPKESVHDLDNIKLNTLKDVQEVYALYELEHILIEGHSRDTTTGSAPRGAQLVLGTPQKAHTMDTIIMANLGYFQFKANPGVWEMDLLSGKSQDLYSFDSPGSKGPRPQPGDESRQIEVLDFQGKTLFPRLSRKPGREMDDVLETFIDQPDAPLSYFSRVLKLAGNLLSGVGLARDSQQADINIFSVASGHLYERMLNIMMISVMKHTQYSVKFWFIEQFLSPSFKVLRSLRKGSAKDMTDCAQDSIPHLAAEYGFNYEMVTYKWPHWLRAQREKQREIWGYKILFLDVLFPLSLNKVIFVDADQIVRTDMYDLVRHDLGGAVYGFTPMGDSRSEMEGFRFWKQGYWKTYLRGLPYHISALYVVDLHKFRQVAAGDRLRQQYQQLSADPNSLSNLDQDLPNHMQHTLPIHSLPQEWLWCETWCSDEDLATARTIDLCNNPMTKEPKLDRARRQVPEWTVYDDEIREVIRRRSREGSALRGKHSIATGSSDLHSSSLRESVTTSSAAKDEL
ncbi:MAG: hypothetical protein M1826_006438 [Phylliscum demangeonii]|nr:MAG: hypothetical protein M1826_006438 [Phylliscum demangeonii]